VKFSKTEIFIISLKNSHFKSVFYFTLNKDWQLSLKLKDNIINVVNKFLTFL